MILIWLSALLLITENFLIIKDRLHRCFLEIQIILPKSQVICSLKKKKGSEVAWLYITSNLVVCIILLLNASAVNILVNDFQVAA